MSSCFYFLYLYTVFLTLFPRTVYNVLFIILNSSSSSWTNMFHNSKLIWIFQTHWVKSSNKSSQFIENTLLFRLLCILLDRHACSCLTLSLFSRETEKYQKMFSTITYIYLYQNLRHTYVRTILLFILIRLQIQNFSQI